MPKKSRSKKQGVKKQEQKVNCEVAGYDDDDDDGNGGATGRGRNAPGKIFAPGGKLVSERLRSMTEDERVRMGTR